MIRRIFAKVRTEFWWWLEMRAGAAWQLICPEDEASCWFDSVPAFCYRQRKAAERQLQAAV